MSKFEDDLARGCLPTGEPLESLYGMGWWTERDEPEPYPFDLHIAELNARIAELEGLVDRLVEVGDELADDREYQDDLVDTWHDLVHDYKAR